MTSQNENVLPFDGDVYYYPHFLAQSQADDYFNIFLQSIDWQNDELFLYGKRIVTKRQVAWYGDEPYNYHYSNATKTALAFTPELLTLKRYVELITASSYNSCLLNLYNSGDVGISWHSDNEKELLAEGTIASVSLGATRKMSFKHKKLGTRADILLEHGSLLIMAGQTQSHWLHCLPQTRKVTQARINLTFRTIVKG